MKRSLLLAVVGLCLASSGARAGDVVAVVSAKSPIASLAANEVADIFLGKTSRYPDGSIAIPIDLREDSPVREKFYVQLAGKSPAQMKAHWSRISFTGRGQPPREVSTGSEARKTIAENPSAIGYIDASQVDASVRVLSLK